MMYRIVWEMDIEADNPVTAAQGAWEAMRAPDSTANVFQVRAIGGGSESVEVDLSDTYYPTPCASNARDGWEYTHAWVAGMMYVHAGDVAEVAETRPDIACERCDDTYLSVANA